VIGNEAYVRNTCEVLLAFLCHSEKIEFRKVLQGHGLKGDDFLTPFGLTKDGLDIFSHSKATKKMWTPRKSELLNKHYIRPITTKGKQEKYYAITPIGIVYLCQNYLPEDDFIKHFFNMVMKSLLFHHELVKTTAVSYRKLVVGSYDLLQDKLFDVVDSVKIKHFGDHGTSIDLTYLSLLDSVIHIGTHHFSQDQKGKPLFTEKYLPTKNLEKDEEILLEDYDQTTELEIYQKISTFIIKALFYEYVSGQIIVLKFYKHPSTSPRKIKQLEEKFNNIPDEHLWIASDFHRDLRNILFLNIKEAEQVARVYYDHLLA